MKVSQRLVTGVAAVGLIGGVTVFVAGPASAATNAAASCQIKSGTSGQQGTNAHGLPEISGWSVAKPAAGTTTCNDFNLWTGVSGVSYEGWLRGSDGNWGACDAGYVKYSGKPVVLCSAVLPGTIMAITATNGVGTALQVEI